MKSGYDQFFKKARSVKKPTSNAQVNTKATRKVEQMMRTSRPRRKSQPPVTSFLLFAVGVSLLAFIGLNADQVEKFLEGVEVQLFAAASAESEQKSQPAANSAQPSAPETAPVAPKMTNLSEEEINIFSKLEDRKKDLDLKEAELKKLDEELQKQKGELDQRMKELEDVRREVATQLEEKVETDTQRVDQLVSFYSTMKPVNAAKIVENLNEDLAVEVMMRMKKKNAADIMNLLKADKAQRLSEKFAGYRRK